MVSVLKCATLNVTVVSITPPNSNVSRWVVDSTYHILEKHIRQLSLNHHIDLSWNQIETSILIIYEKLAELSLLEEGTYPETSNFENSG